MLLTPAESPVCESAAGLTLAVGLGEARALPASDASPNDSLVAYGLGSCVALCLFDAHQRVAGMAHVVLPGTDPQGQPNPKFARSALSALVDLMWAAGAARNIRGYAVRLAGGAQVLALAGGRGVPRIGEQNVIAIREALSEAGLTVHGADLGGSRGRTVWLSPQKGGVIRVRTVGAADRFV